jgi:nucleotide-binding universal stress UspA family protein
MGTPFRILVPVDFSETSVRALDTAIQWAERPAVALHLAHVVERDGSGVNVELAHDLEEMGCLAERELVTLIPEARRRQPIGELARHVAIGPPATRILELAARLRPQLIIMGTHGRARAHRRTLGPVAEQIMRHATCPVLFVKPGAEAAAPSTWHRLLCPLDFSETSRRAMQAAIDLALRLGIALELLHVVELPRFAAIEDGALEGCVLDARQRAAALELDRWRAEADRLAGGELEVATELVLGSPAEEILRAVRRHSADAIVMGTHGQTAVEHLVMGSVADRVVRTAPCPVLTLRSRAP